MNSVPVTEDMVALVERHGEWREKTAISLLTSARGELRRRGTFTPEALSPEVTIALQRTKWKVGKEKLLYWGTSYGTVLGQLFAHLHPERVSRVLLDAVVDTDVYLNSKWDAHLEQADDVLEFFFDLCSRSSACAFREGDAKTTRDRFNKLLESLTKEPVSVASSRKPLISADSITSSDLMRLVRDAIYYPLRMFSYLDSILVDLERGNGTTLAARKQSDFSSHEQPQERCGSDTAFSPECHNPAEIEIEAVASIMCSDNRVIDSMSDQGFFAYMETLQTRSHYMGWYWAECQMLCRAWSVKSRWHVDGPLHANTAEPILFVGNSVDPVTPLRSAMKASKQFPGSGVLHQDSVGHTLLSSPSLCTAKKVRAYFQHGSLPSPSVKCEVDMLPFSGEVSIKDVEGSLSSSDKTLLMDLRRLVSRHDGLYH
jgi:pimeloyl-ACP methyl ester carboxylesterase